MKELLYLTYEELKRVLHFLFSSIVYYTLYLTYEELKLFDALNPISVQFGLYLTYEELKLHCGGDLSCYIVLPMNVVPYL